jgi:hypothetical protein
MTSPDQTPHLELQKQLWKARAQAKQKWLEQSLAQPAKSSEDAAWRLTWIKRALEMVKRAQAEIKYHAALMDASTEHLSVLEMTLMAAAEQKRSTEKRQGCSRPSVATGARVRRTAGGDGNGVPSRLNDDRWRCWLANRSAAG